MVNLLNSLTILFIFSLSSLSNSDSRLFSISSLSFSSSSDLTSIIISSSSVFYISSSFEFEIFISCKKETFLNNDLHISWFEITLELSIYHNYSVYTRDLEEKNFAQVEAYLEPSQPSMVELFAKIVSS